MPKQIQNGSFLPLSETPNETAELLLEDIGELGDTLAVFEGKATLALTEAQAGTADTDAGKVYVGSDGSSAMFIATCYAKPCTTAANVVSNEVSVAE